MKNIFQRFQEVHKTAFNQVKSESKNDFVVDKQGAEEVAKTIAPVIQEIVKNAKVNKEDMHELMTQMRAEVAAQNHKYTDTSPIINAIEQAFGGVSIPETKVTVNIGEKEMRQMAKYIEFPKEMDIRGWVSLMGVSLEKPLPVHLRNADGSPFVFQQSQSMGGGGAAHIVKISEAIKPLASRVQVRGKLATAYVSLSNGTETTLLAALSGTFADLIWIIGTNNSDAAVSVDFRSATGGNVVATLVIPASGTAGISTNAPLPQDNSGNNWTADLSDITGTTVTLSALFSKET